MLRCTFIHRRAVFAYWRRLQIKQLRNGLIMSFVYTLPTLIWALLMLTLVNEVRVTRLDGFTTRHEEHEIRTEKCSDMSAQEKICSDIYQKWSDITRNLCYNIRSLLRHTRWELYRSTSMSDVQLLFHAVRLMFTGEPVHGLAILKARCKVHYSYVWHAMHMQVDWQTTTIMIVIVFLCDSLDGCVSP